MVDPEGGDKVSNTFEEIQPLDDLQLIRRKSLQLTPTGSRSSSNRGSRTDLSNLLPVEEDNSSEHQRVLKFADESVEPGKESLIPTEEVDVKKMCKNLRKIEMTDEEISSIIDVMLKKEEHNNWINKSKKPSVLLQLKKDVQEKQEQLEEAQELNNSLQAKLKQLRAEFVEEKASLAKERKELEESVENLNLQLNAAKASSRLQELEERLKTESAENARLNESIREQQSVIKAALARLYPNLSTEELCQEHQDILDKFVEKMKREQTN